MPVVTFVKRALESLEIGGPYRGPYAWFEQEDKEERVYASNVLSLSQTLHYSTTPPVPHRHHP